MRDGERQAEVGGNRPGPVGAQGEVEAGQCFAVRTENLGDDADGEHADSGRDVRGDGHEGMHTSVWHQSCDQRQLCHW